MQSIENLTKLAQSMMECIELRKKSKKSKKSKKFKATKKLKKSYTDLFAYAEKHCPNDGDGVEASENFCRSFEPRKKSDVLSNGKSILKDIPRKQRQVSAYPFVRWQSKIYMLLSVVGDVSDAKILFAIDEKGEVCLLHEQPYSELFEYAERYCQKDGDTVEASEDFEQGLISDVLGSNGEESILDTIPEGDRKVSAYAFLNYQGCIYMLLNTLEDALDSTDKKLYVINKENQIHMFNVNDILSHLGIEFSDDDDSQSWTPVTVNPNLVRATLPLETVKQEIITAVNKYIDDTSDDPYIEKKPGSCCSFSFYTPHGSTGRKRASDLNREITAAGNLNDIKVALKKCFSEDQYYFHKPRTNNYSLISYILTQENVVKALDINVNLMNERTDYHDDNAKEKRVEALKAFQNLACDAAEPKVNDIKEDIISAVQKYLDFVSHVFARCGGSFFTFKHGSVGKRRAELLMKNIQLAVDINGVKKALSDCFKSNEYFMCGAGKSKNSLVQYILDVPNIKTELGITITGITDNGPPSLTTLRAEAIQKFRSCAAA